MGKWALDEEVALDLLGRRERVDPPLVATGAALEEAAREVLDAASDRDQGRVGVDGRELPGEAIRVRDVVGIHAREIPSASPAARRFKRLGDSSRRTGDEPDAGIFRGPAAQDLRRGVPRAVVDRDDLEVIQSLPSDGDDRLGEVSRSVPDG